MILVVNRDLILVSGGRLDAAFLALLTIRALTILLTKVGKKEAGFIFAVSVLATKAPNVSGLVLFDVDIGSNPFISLN
jgi:hypothetical protein